MSLKDKLPLLNSSNKVTRIVGYVVYASLGLMVLGILSGPAPTAEVKGDEAPDQPASEEDECIDENTYGIRAGDVLMQTGYFKKADMLVYKDDRIKVIVEPSTLGYSDVDFIQPFLFGAISATPDCLGVKDVEIEVRLQDYDLTLEYPFAASQNSTEMEGRDWRIEQK